MLTLSRPQPLAGTKRASPARMRATPVVKWAGGKGRLLPQLRVLLPTDLRERRHIEPFVGGGALFFAHATGAAIIGDVNENLVNMYRVARDAPERLVVALRELIATPYTPERYYELRASYNRWLKSPRRASEVRRAAVFIYLNRTGFNGLHRVNSRGELNVPAGRYQNPTILQEEAIHAASRALSTAKLVLGDFAETCALAAPGDFVYLDPPYLPASSRQFTRYSGEFGLAEHARLAGVFRELDARGCRVMSSNSCCKQVAELYRDFRIDVVSAPRAINSRGSGRGAVSEYVIRNY